MLDDTGSILPRPPLDVEALPAALELEAVLFSRWRSPLDGLDEVDVLSHGRPIDRDELVEPFNGVFRSCTVRLRDEHRSADRMARDVHDEVAGADLTLPFDDVQDPRVGV